MCYAPLREQRSAIRPPHSPFCQLTRAARASRAEPSPTDGQHAALRIGSPPSRAVGAGSVPRCRPRTRPGPPPRWGADPHHPAVNRLGVRAPPARDRARSYRRADERTSGQRSADERSAIRPPHSALRIPHSVGPPARLELRGQSPLPQTRGQSSVVSRQSSADERTSGQRSADERSAIRPPHSAFRIPHSVGPSSALGGGSRSPSREQALGPRPPIAGQSPLLPTSGRAVGTSFEF